MKQNHWIIRVADGKNFKNSNFPFWGLKAGKKDIVKNSALKIKEGDILWFLCNKSNDNKIIGMATLIIHRRSDLINYWSISRCFYLFDNILHI